jgi:co-chaperonin GroES (HSP10)
MNINQLVPTNNKLLIEVTKEQNITNSGFIVNSTVEYKSVQTGTVKNKNGEDLPSLNEEVLFRKKSAPIYTEEDKEYFIVDKEDILGVFKNGN